jgi:acetyltransferase-like isoleucine patch superfamily enzyme
MGRNPLHTPWKVRNELCRCLAYPRIRVLFAFYGIPWRKGWRFYGTPIIQKHRLSKMSFGPGLQLRSYVRSNPMAPNHPVILSTWQEGAHLEVGSNFRMTGGSICAAAKIAIGNNVVVGANTTIIDTDFHPLDWAQRWSRPSEGRTSAVVIQDDVFIGMNCLILKGAKIGQGSVIGAGSVVTDEVPPQVIAAGNPLAIIKRI